MIRATPGQGAERVRAVGADEPTCPTCGAPIQIQIVYGWGFAYCRGKRTLPDGRRERCGQHMHILAGEGVAYITCLSAAEYGRMRRYVSWREVYTHLSIDPPCGFREAA